MAFSFYKQFDAMDCGPTSLPMYLVFSGGVLNAAAMIVGSYEGGTTEMPWIPKDSIWKVKWEGLKKMP
jgi:hypothetical protein